MIDAGGCGWPPAARERGKAIVLSDAFEVPWISVRSPRESYNADPRPPGRRWRFTGARVKQVLTDGKRGILARCEMRNGPSLDRRADRKHSTSHRRKEAPEVGVFATRQFYVVVRCQAV